MDYNEQMKNLINSLRTKPTLLLHCCCAPCSSSVLEKLKDHFKITLFYYNPNIMPKEEWEKRKNEFEKLKSISNFNFVCPEQSTSEFLKLSKGLENESEGGSRCKACIAHRISKAFDFAKNNLFDFFCTTLSVSPHKNAEIINQIGLSLQSEKTKWLPNDFKKENGFLRTIELCKSLNIYRQNYCGCQLKK